MNREEITGSLSKAGLGKLLPDIQNLLQESIRITITPARTGTGVTQAEPAAIPAGSSHFGGLPDIPWGFTWPEYKGLPMSFIGQISLEDINKFEPAKKLPETGLLSFFYDANQETYGGSPDDRGGWAVCFFGGLVRLALHTSGAPTHLNESARFKACKLSFSSEFTLPTSAAQHIENLNWSEADIQAYENFLAGFPTSTDYTSRHHRMFGHPNQLQDDMQLQSALYANGVQSINDPRAAALVQQKEDWLLLLQVDSDDTPGMKWATSGLLYFWINAKSLSEHKFDETWLVLQAE